MIRSLREHYTSFTSKHNILNLSVLLRIFKFKNKGFICKLRKLPKLLKMKNKIVWSDLSPHGDLIPMSEFKNHMDHEFMIPGWDGSGKYATEDKMSNLYVPEKPEDLDLSYSHVIWFNV